MNIRIIKNGYRIKGKVYGKYILEKLFSPSEYEGINIVRYFIYNPEKNERYELLAEKVKYDILKIKNLDKDKNFLYYTTLSEGTAGKQQIKLYRYNIELNDSVQIYSFEDELGEYDDYKRKKLFVINEAYLLMQNEYIRYNLTESCKGYFEFEQYLYCINEDKLIRIADENLRQNGIENIKILDNNVCVLKTGFNLITDERYKHLSKEEASLEKISFVNLGQLISDIMLMKNDIVIDTIDQAYYDYTLPYITIKGKYIVYSKVSIANNEEQVIFYNIENRKSTVCINKNVYGTKDLAWSYCIGGIPYIKLEYKKGTQFYNLIKNSSDIRFPEGCTVENVLNDVFIVSEKKKRLFRKKTQYVAVYGFPNLNKLHVEKGEYLGSIAVGSDKVYILMV